MQSLDFRVSKEFRIGSRLRVTGMAEVFNIYNYKRYSYNLVETNAAYGQQNASAGPPAPDSWPSGSRSDDVSRKPAGRSRGHGCRRRRR